MAREERSSRPYKNLRPCQEAFEKTTLHVGDVVLEDGASTRLTEREFLNEPFVIKFGKTEEDFNELVLALKHAADVHKISHDQLKVMVVTYSTFWKISESLFCKGLDEFSLSDSTVTVATRTKRDRSLGFPSSQLRIEAYCVLSETIDKQPLSPYRAGTWLTKTTYKLSTDQSFTGFQPRMLDDAARKKFGLEDSPMVQRYMDVEADPTDPASSEEDFGLYVDETLLQTLLDNSRTSGTSIIQRLLGMNIARALIYRAASALNEDTKSLDDIQSSIFDKVLDAFSRDKNGKVKREDKERLFDTVKKRPELFVAIVEDRLVENSKLDKDLIELVKGDAS